MTLQPHDTFRVEGVHAIHPITGADTGVSKETVVISVDPLRYWPLFLPEGPYRNVTTAPTHDALVTHINGHPVSDPTTWADVGGGRPRRV